MEDAAAVVIQPAGRIAKLFNDDTFSKLRAQAQVPDDFVNSGWDYDMLTGGGGKGGSLMARVGNEFIVKELSDGDHNVLVSVAESYGHHVRGGETLLCPIYLHYMDTLSGRKFFVMRNSIGLGPFRLVYDLKGCADDKTVVRDDTPVVAVHKRITKPSMWIGKRAWSEKRHVYYRGKVEARSVTLDVTHEQRSQILSMIKRDTNWFKGHGLMDYSLLVAVQEVPSSATRDSSPSIVGPRPWVRKGPGNVDVVLHVSIIDFLQKWTFAKKVAMLLKSVERNKATVPPAQYADRFFRHFSERFREVVEATHPADSVPSSIAPPAGDSASQSRPEDDPGLSTSPSRV
eukprot:CAMPEP_0117506522 /NCGR_PEP_ID=MMETSP0784-20121206/25951_1 /TAXON_ID=39447 /ORGANISM="" /LENGTH=343 /DNA_ID=CAMNT_0005301997 /DNA_START=182 /DNA_END=1213 /DNA_ORIENTATION=+